MSLSFGAHNIMTLNKEYCIKCYYNYGWTDCDDEFWFVEDQQWGRYKMIDCPTEYIGKGESMRRKITSEPPIKCPFYLEHILTQGNK